MAAKRTVHLFAATGAMLGCLFGQTTTSTTAGSGSTNPTNTGTTGTTSGTTTTTPTVVGNAPGAGTQRPIFLSGTVMMDDGSHLPGSVTIQSICGPLRRTMAHTSGGAFSFQWSTTPSAFGDASEAGRMAAGNGASSLTGSRNGSRGLDPLANCELLADYGGYSSTRISLYDRAGQDNYDVGVIVMHRILNGEGHTVSFLALRAPKNAKKSFEKGTSLAAANKPAEALASFRSAVAIYPQYADAWLAMGKIQWQAGQKEGARVSFQKSMDLDSKLVGSWQELGYLACDESKWEDAVRYLDEAVRLDPLDSPAPWYFDALANYNLGRFDLAERDVRSELKMDRGRNPQADYLLGLVLIARNDLQAGAEALRNYIASAPQSPNVATAQRELAKVEGRIGH